MIKIKKKKKINTLPLNVKQENYHREYLSKENKFEFQCAYGNQGDLYKLSQKFNPLYVNILELLITEQKMC